MHANQPLTSIEAFALALVEASSRLAGTDASSPDDASARPAPHSDEPAPAIE